MGAGAAPLRGLLLVLLTCALPSPAEESRPPPNCLDCHSVSAVTPVLAVQRTEHARVGGGNAGCVACHGPSPEHRRQPRQAAPEVAFADAGDGAAAPAGDGACRDCHADGALAHWNSSAHADAEVGCGGCHRIHERPALALFGQESGDERCVACHGELRAALRMPSRHPILEGKTGCSDCHDPHGGAGEFALRDLSVNDNCTRCHSEKRGPFLWEHQPVTEDCSLCHRAHGSVHDRLLTVRGPALCQQCHSAAFHPSLPYGAATAGAPGAVNVLGKNCLNCHGQVHGSNHPAGARLTR